MGDENERSETERGLRSAKNFMRKAIADGLKLRSSPDLRFVYDDSLDRAIAIEEALKQTRSELDEDDNPEQDK